MTQRRTGSCGGSIERPGNIRPLEIRLLLLSIVLLWPAFGQTIAGVVTDPTGAAVPAARVQLSSSAADQRESLTGPAGDFRFDDLPAGRYELRLMVSGFEPVRRNVRTGQRVSVRLTLARHREELTVAEPEYSVAADTARNADTISVERSMLDNLPILDLDYLGALARFLDPGSPGGAGTSVIVDGMEMRKVGVTASAIQEIRINNNPYTVEYPRWSRRRIEVITKSSADRYHGTLNFLFRDYHMNAREALAADRPKEQRRIYEGSLFGPLGRSRNASFLLSGAREEEDLHAVVYARGPRGAIQENVPAPQVNTVASLRISLQKSDRQAAFWQVNFQDRWQDNLGVGGTTLAEAGSQLRFREDEFIFNHRFVFTPKLLSQFRVLLGRYWSPTHSNLPDAGVAVTEAFRGGGAQADRLSTEVHTSITWLLTQTLGRHTLKYGFNVPDWSRRGLSDRSNQIGTLYFASLGDLQSLHPYAAILQRGDPRTILIEKNVGGFFQDEWQARSGLSVAAGLRYDWQNNFGDSNNVAPRLALAWSPLKSRNFVLRAGAGFFFERSGPGPVWDIMRYNGIQLGRYVLSGAQFPGGSLPPDASGFPASIHRLAQDARLPNAMQISAGLERQLGRNATLAVNYSGVRAVQQLRSRDGNAPLPPDFGARPNPSVNVLRWIEAAGRAEGNALEVTVRGKLAPRVTGTAQYVFGRTMTDTGGVNWFPAASFAPSGEWGRADTDRLHQFNFLGTATLHRWLNFGLSVSLLSGIPFNITTGRDENGDGMAIDRPAGGTRNTGNGPGVALVDLRWYRDFRLSSRLKDKGPALTCSVDAFNLFNRVNYQNYIGALTSPFFGRAVATSPARRLQLALRFQF